jgi:hypothetical protein
MLFECNEGGLGTDGYLAECARENKPVETEVTCELIPGVRLATGCIVD